MNATLTRQLDRARAELLSLANRDQMPADAVVLAEAVGLTPDPWQVGVLRSTSRRLLLNCCRQSGKSTTTALLALHRALYVPGSMVIMGSPGLRQSSELFRKALGFYRRLGRPVAAEAETRLELELTNGSRIVALPGSGDTVRSYSAVSLLLVDEASRVEDELMGALRPMLATTNGQMIAMSTPAGKRGWWYDAWSEGGAAWDRVRVPAVDCPRISAAFLEDERRSLGQQVYAAEFLCEFTDTLDAVFRTDDIAAALDPSLEPLWGGSVTEYFVGLDLGQSIDYTALAIAEVLPVEIGERTRQEQVYVGQGRGWAGGVAGPIYEVRERQVAVTERHYQLRHLQRYPLGTSYPRIVEQVCAMLDREPLRSGTVVLALDWTGVGRPVLDMFVRSKPRARVVPVSIHGGDHAVRDGAGWHTPKRDLIGTAQVALQSGRLKIAAALPEADTLTKELADYRVKISQSGHDSYDAREGAHDDLVLAVALALWVSEHGRRPRWDVAAS